MSLWLTLAGAASASAALKAAGPALVGSRPLPSAARRIVAHLAPALLAAMIVVQTFGAGERLVLDARALGLATAAGALALRVPALPAIALAAAVAAVTRTLT